MIARHVPSNLKAEDINSVIKFLKFCLKQYKTNPDCDVVLGSTSGMDSFAVEICTSASILKADYRRKAYLAYCRDYVQALEARLSELKKIEGFFKKP